MKRDKWFGKLAGLAALLVLAAGCGGLMYLDPGPDPARVRVIFSVTADRSGESPLDYILPDTYWDWGLYLERPGGELTRLPPADGQQLTGIKGDNTLARDTVFLAPPGPRKLVLLVEGSIRVKTGMFYDPQSIAGFKKEYQADLRSGQTFTIRVDRARGR